MIKFLYVTDSDNGQVLEKRDVYHNETDGTLHLGSLKVTGSMHTTPLLLPLRCLGTSAAVLTALASETVLFRRHRRC